MSAGGAESRGPPTPILDRLQPVPGPADVSARSLPWGRLVFFAVAVAIGFSLALFGASGVLTVRPSGRSGTAEWAWVVPLLVSVPALVVVHELGHLVAGWLVGFKLLQFRVGPLVIDRPFRVSWSSLRGLGYVGLAQMIPVRTKGLRGRAAVYLAGGPASNLLTAALLFALAPADGTAAVFCDISLLFGLMNLVPLRTARVTSDGACLWLLLKQPAWIQRKLANRRLVADIQAGVLPEDLSPVWIAEATGLVDASLDTLQAHLFAYGAASEQRRDAEAGRLLEVCLTQAASASQYVRDAVFSEAAWFQARCRKSVDLAERWLAEVHPMTTAASSRLGAEVAILVERGDVTGASAKLDEIERIYVAYPEEWRRKHSLALLARRRAELAGAPSKLASAAR